jgi:hypothetical protein
MKVEVTPTGRVSIVATPDEAAALAGRPTCEADPEKLRDEIAAEVWKATARGGRQWSGRDRHPCRLERPTVESEYWQSGYGDRPPRRVSRPECIGYDPYHALGKLIEQHGDELDDERDDDEPEDDDGCAA